MFRIIGLGLAGLAFMLVIGFAEAQDQKKKFNPEESFKKLDANSDGKLSKDEYLKSAERVTDAEKQAKFKEGLTKMFDKHNKDGFLTFDAYKDAGKEMFSNFKKKNK